MCKNRPLCGECRSRRRKFKKADQKGHGRFSNFLIGFSNSEIHALEKGIDVLFVLESHGGHEDAFKEEKDFRTADQSAVWLRDYYLSEKIKKFHQYEIRKLLAVLRDERPPLQYFITDVVKCYVAKEGRNMLQAERYCSQYLKDQIDLLDPKIFVTFGNSAYKAMKRIGLSEDKIVRLVFPGSRSADRWVEQREDKSPIERIKEKLHANQGS